MCHAWINGEELGISGLKCATNVFVSIITALTQQESDGKCQHLIINFTRSSVNINLCNLGVMLCKKKHIFNRHFQLCYS